MCRRTTDDPLVKAMLEKYGLNLLSIPRKDGSCGDLYITEGAHVLPPSRLASVMLPPAPDLPKVKRNEKLGDLIGVSSKSVSTDAGFGLFATLLEAFGAAGLLSKIEAKYRQKSVRALRLQLKDAVRDSIDPVILGSRISACKFDGGNPLIDAKKKYYVVVGVVKTRSMAILSDSESKAKIGFAPEDIAGIKALCEASAGIEFDANGTLTYTGSERLAVGVELLELKLDFKGGGGVGLAAPRGPMPGPLRDKTRRPMGAFIGPPDGDIFI